MQNIYAATEDVPVSRVSVDARARFVTRTYLHLFGAISAFVLLEVALFQTGVAARIAAPLAGNWLLVLGGFMLASWLFTHAAHRARSLPMQYLALAAFVAVEAVVFVPLLFLAASYGGGVIESAAIVTMGGFLGLTGIAIWTRKDFSFLGSLLRWAFVCALVAIVAALVFGFALGTWFSVGMVALAGGAILYDTSNVLRHYPEDRYVGAALQLFASVALLFWYVLSLFLSSRD